MGGIMFIIGSILACAAGWCTIAFSAQGLVDASSHGTFYLVGGFLMALGFGVIGFLDDYIKVVKKRNLGLKAWQKSAAQLLVAVIYLIAERIFAPNDLLWIPFAGEFSIGWFYYPLMLFIIIGAVNAVNLTDGVDGLAASVTMVAAMGFMLIAAIQSFTQMDLMAAHLLAAVWASWFGIFIRQRCLWVIPDRCFWAAWWLRWHLGLRKPVLLLFIGIVYVVETMSDIIQIGSVKLTGKRVFKMAPIHHHFEKCGWSETRVVAVFSIITALCCLVAFAAV